MPQRDIVLRGVCMKTILVVFFLLLGSLSLWGQITLYEGAKERGEQVIGAGFFGGINQVDKNFFGKGTSIGNSNLVPIVGLSFEYWGRTPEAGRYDNVRLLAWLSPSLANPDKAGAYTSDFGGNVSYRSLWRVRDDAAMLVLTGWHFGVLYERNKIRVAGSKTTLDATGSSNNYAPDANYNLSNVELGFSSEFQWKISDFHRFYLGLEIPLFFQLFSAQTSPATEAGKASAVAGQWDFGVLVPTQVTAELGLMWGSIRESEERFYTIYNRFYYRFSTVNNVGSIQALSKQSSNIVFFSHSIGFSFFVD